MHDEFADDRISLFIGCRNVGSMHTVFMDIHTQNHGDDIEFSPKRGTKMRREICERLADTSANEFAAVSFGEDAYLMETMFGEHMCGVGRVVQSYMNLMDAKVDRVIGVVHRKTNFNSRFIIQNTC